MHHYTTLWMFVLKNCHAPQLCEANFHARLSLSKQLLKNIYPIMLASFCLLTKRHLQWPHRKTHSLKWKKHSGTFTHDNRVFSVSYKTSTVTQLANSVLTRISGPLKWSVKMRALLLTIVFSHKKRKNVLDFQGFGKTTRILGLKKWNVAQAKYNPHYINQLALLSHSVAFHPQIKYIFLAWTLKKKPMQFSHIQTLKKPRKLYPNQQYIFTSFSCVHRNKIRMMQKCISRDHHKTKVAQCKKN